MAGGLNRPDHVVGGEECLARRNGGGATPPQLTQHQTRILPDRRHTVVGANPRTMRRSSLRLLGRLGKALGAEAGVVSSEAASGARTFFAAALRSPLIGGGPRAREVVVVSLSRADRWARLARPFAAQRCQWIPMSAFRCRRRRPTGPAGDWLPPPAPPAAAPVCRCLAPALPLPEW